MLGYDCCIRCLCSEDLWVFSFPVGMCGGQVFQDFMHLYTGLFSYLDVVCFGKISFPWVDWRVFPVEICCMNVLLISSGLWNSSDLCVNVDSWRYLRWWSFGILSFWKDLVAESDFLLPVIDLTAKFWTVCILWLFTTPQPPQTISA